METTETTEVKFKSLRIALDDIINGLNQKTAEQKVEAELARQGATRLKNIPLQTPNLITPEILEWISHIQNTINDEPDSTAKNHSIWLLDVVNNLIAQQAIQEDETKRWRTLADGMLIEWMKSTMGIRGEPLGRARQCDKLDGGLDALGPKAAAVGLI